MKLLFILLLGLGFSQTEMKEIEIIVPKNDMIINNYGYFINMSDYLDVDIEYSWVKINLLEDNFQGNAHDFYISPASGDGGTILFVNNRMRFPGPNEGYNIGVTDELFFQKNSCEQDGNDCSFWIHFYNWNNSFFDNIPDNIILNITAPFPEQDTGYIDEGYQFCVQPGANLLSFPCDNPISVNQSLPQGAENFITQIVGQGVATTYNPALGWVGSLDNFSPGSGYWFKSNESLCFEYDCVED